MSAWKNVRMITYGFLIGTAGVAILSSKDMKAAYQQQSAHRRSLTQGRWLRKRMQKRRRRRTGHEVQNPA